MDGNAGHRWVNAIGRFASFSLTSLFRRLDLSFTLPGAAQRDDDMAGDADRLALQEHASRANGSLGSTPADRVAP
jgi:hypothetical protein